MRLVVLQPGYLPWLGYFDQLARSDLFVHLDDVQYDKHGWRNRNRIRTNAPEGWSWLSVPVRTGGRFGARIDAVEIDAHARTGAKHWRTLEQHYRKAPFFAEHAPVLEEVYRQEWRLLVDLDLALVERLARAFGLGEKKTVRSSALDLPEGLDATDRLLALCERFGAKEYFSGAAARDYLEVERFRARGVEVVFQDYAHPTYRQVYPGFVSHLSAVDLLFNVGPGSGAVLAGK